MRHWGLKQRIHRSLWEADHIIPVIEGGGECDLDSIRTLCLRCHRKATAALQQVVSRLFRTFDFSLIVGRFS
jgi:5-methylcytosine-specific restriction endonuclease McrA